MVSAPWFGPEVSDTTACTHCPLPGCPGRGVPVITRPADGLPQSAMRVDDTVAASVLTAPPEPFWNGSGMSTLWLLGHSRTAPMTTARPITARMIATILAASGLSGAGPVCECECECVTRTG